MIVVIMMTMMISMLALCKNSMARGDLYFLNLKHGKSGNFCAGDSGDNDDIDATHGVTVSTSAFLACHQCYCAGSSLTWGLNLRALVCGIF